MRIGFLARTKLRLVALVVASAAGAAAPRTLHGQYYGQGAPAASGRPTQALYMASGASGRQRTYTDSYGNPLVVPAQYDEACGYGGCGDCGCECGCYSDGCDGGGFHGGCYGSPGCVGTYGPNGCMPMGCGGTDPPIGYDLMNDAGIEGTF